MIRFRITRVLLAGVVLTLSSASGRAADLATEYKTVVRPLVSAHCLGCHSTEKQEGDLDLELVASAKLARKDLPTWKSILERVESGEMPPKKNPHKPLAEKDRERLAAWIRALLAYEIRANAGDPGPAVVRRLTNAEYDNTIRDLTGVNLRPTREFPADGAGGEGFANASDVLEISPELLTKYLAAAKQIAGCAVLLPDRIRFSESPFQQDWVDESVAELSAFYTRWTDKGMIPLDRYLTALSQNRTSLESGKLSFVALAEREKLSERYLESLWQLLQDDPSKNLFLSRLRKEWKSAEVKDAPLLVSRIESWKTALWSTRIEAMKVVVEPTLPKFAFEPQSFSLISNNFKPPQVVFFIAARAFASDDRTIIRWENARFEAEGMPTIYLRDMLVKAGYEKLPAEVPPPESRETEVTRNRDGIIVSVPWVPQITLDRFGRHPLGKPLNENSFVTTGSEVLAVRLPADLIGKEDSTRGGSLTGLQFVVDAQLDPESSPEAVVQFNVQPYRVRDELINPLQAANGGPTHFAPAKGVGPEKLQKDADDFRGMFPAIACITNVATTGGADRVHKQDEPLIRLLLNDVQLKAYERMWDDFSFVSRAAIDRVDTANSFAKGENPELEAQRKEFDLVAENLREEIVAAEPAHLQSALTLAGRAFRRPLQESESRRIKDLYRELRDKEIPHEEAIRAVLASIFVAPEFLYRLEKAPAGKSPGPLSDWELASRLSYFLWASMPDDELSRVAAAGKLRDPVVLDAQTMRMLKDPRAQGMAIEFGMQWLGVRGFDEFQGRDESLFPAFTPQLRADMYEESVLLIQELFRSDLSVTTLLDADHTFLNERLAAFYGIPAVQGTEWRRVNGVRKYGRGGILGLASVLTKHSGASRTSPVLRGIFVVDRLLGEKIPTPPKGVPTLPDGEDPTGLTVRQMVERHVQDAQCAGCHKLIDPVGFSLENFDTIGGWRDKDSGGRPVDAKAKTLDGSEFEGIAGLRTFILSQRKADFQRQFCKKLLGYALGRAVSFMDQPLVDEMIKAGNQRDGRVSAAVLTIVRSPQFNSIRGAEFAANEVGSR